MSDCRLCEKEKENKRIMTNYSFATVFDNPIKFGHFIVAPKRHVNNFIELSQNEVKDLYILTHRIAQLLHKKLKEDKLYQLYIGDKDTHFHLHLIPRKADEVKLGPFIFGPDGWRGKAQEKIDQVDSDVLLQYVKEKI